MLRIQQISSCCFCAKRISFFKAAKRLCVCDKCQLEYGTCELFKEFTLDIKHLKKNTLRPAFLDSLGKNTHQSIIDFAIPDSICAIGAYDKSHETVWFKKIMHGEQTAKDNITDDCSHSILPGQKFIEGRYLEKVLEQKNTIKYK